MQINKNSVFFEECTYMILAAVIFVLTITLVLVRAYNIDEVSADVYAQNSKAKVKILEQIVQDYFAEQKREYTAQKRYDNRYNIIPMVFKEQ